MDETVLAYASAAATLGIGVGIAVLTVRSTADAHQRREQLCERRGWQYQKGSGGTVFSIIGAEDNVPFELKSLRSKGKNSSSSRRAVWSTPAEPRDGVVLLGPKIPQMMAGLNMGLPIAQMLLRMVLGEEAADLADIREVPDVGETRFRERFTILASSPGLAQEIASSSVCEALLEFSDNSKEPAAVMRWKERLDIRIPSGLKEAEALERVINLGVIIARRCGHS